MSKAEKFIINCTRSCSNELIAVESRAGKEVISYHEWITPDQARKAVEIAREEMIEKACDAYCKVCKIPNCRSNECKWISDFKKAMKEI